MSTDEQQAVSVGDDCEVQAKKTITHAPFYDSVKRVQGLRVVDITTDTVDSNIVLLHLESLESGEVFEPYRTSPAWVHAKGAEVGGVLVRYVDGYVSYSPLPQFRAGNLHIQTYQPDINDPDPWTTVQSVPRGAHSPYALLQNAMLNDDEYAWSWVANLACAICDAAGNISMVKANMLAYHQLKTVFGVELSDEMKKRLHGS